MKTGSRFNLVVEPVFLKVWKFAPLDYFKLRTSKHLSCGVTSDATADCRQVAVDVNHNHAPRRQVFAVNAAGLDDYAGRKILEGNFL